MPSSSQLDLFHSIGTPRISGGQVNTPRTYKSSKSSRYINLSTQAFKIGHQRVNIDVDLSQSKIDGFTELTVIPTSSSLRAIKLDCREMKIKDVYINNNRMTNYIYKDVLYINDDKFFEDSIANKTVNTFDLYSSSLTIHQHHLIRQKLNYVFGELNYDPRDPPKEINNGNTEELVIILPENLKLELTDISSIHTPGSQPATLTPLHLKSKSTSNDVYTPIRVKIDFEAVNPKNGVNFITDKNSDKRSWHAYTVNSDYNISTSSWVPCIDNLWDRCTWTIEVNVPRTINDIGNPRIIGSKEAMSVYKENRIRKSKIEDGTVEEDSEDDQSDQDSQEDDDEDSENYDLIVCSGDFNNVKETPHPIDLSKKVVSWSIFNPVCAHHVGWTLGCFQSILLSNPSQDAEDEALKEQIPFEDIEKDNTNSPLTIYCLPEQVELARNTCIFAHKAIDFYSKEFGSFPFSSYTIAFVQNNNSDTNNFAGLTIVNDKLLYPPDLIEPMFTTTEILLESIATQWSGINIVPQTFNDLWCTIGIANFMSFQFIKTLMGVNEYRFKIKKKMSEIVEEDIGKKPLALHFFRYPISDHDMDFLRLKAPIVLFILDKRMTKTDKSFGLSRVLPKIFLQAMSGDLQNSTLSTQHFQYVCEKVNRNKLETFFKQWVFGAGVPIFNISQKFNKKRSMIEMSIRQVQQSETKKLHPNPKNLINDSIAYLDDEPSFSIQSVFSGPMTIRIHEADGTPYEHIVDLKEGHTKLDIQYNSRFKKLKKNKDDLNEQTSTFSKLGNVLEDPKNVEEWGLSEWTKREDDILYNDAFEWIRVDADFEWIAKVNVNQPDYMYGSQLQYDRDVEAQYDAVRYFGNQEKPNAVYCTALTRTIMDNRYFYGVRIAAAQALADFSKPNNNFIGISYLIKIFKELFCFHGSSIPLSNDFNDFGKFFLQKEFPIILSNVRDDEGEVPFIIKNLLLNLVKFNENSNNTFQDCFYVADLLKALTNSVVNASGALTSQNPLNLLDEIKPANSGEEKFLDNVITEINRLQKIDEWVPSYQNIIAVTCIKQKIRLATNGLLQLSFEDLLYYTLDKYPFDIRIEAFRGLFILGGLKNASILQYFLKTCLLEATTPYFRAKLIDAFINSICIAAIDSTPSTLDDPEFKTFDKLVDTNSRIANNQTNMVIIEDGSNNEMSTKRDAFARATLNGAIELLRRDYAIGKGLREIFWELLHTSLLSIYERRNIFCICQILYKEIDSFIIKVPIPSVPLSELKRKIVLKKLGIGKVVIKREGRFKIQLASRKLSTTTSDSSKGKRHAEKTKLKSEAESITEPESSIQTPSEPKLKLKLNNVVVSESKKEKKVGNKRIKIGPNLVTFDPNNRFKVIFKFFNHKLPVADDSIFDFPTVSSQNKSDNNIVKVDGSVVTFSFKSANKNKLQKLTNKSSKSVPRYVKILTKKKKVYVSSTPFTEKSNENEERISTINQELENATKKASSKLISPVADEPESNVNLGLNLADTESMKPNSQSNPRDSNDQTVLSSQISKSNSRAPSVESESKSFERSTSPFSKSGSPFSSSSQGTKKKRTKVYIHTGDSTRSPAPLEESKKTDSVDSLASEDTSNSAVGGDKKNKKNKETKSKTGIKLKLNLKR